LACSRSTRFRPVPYVSPRPHIKLEIDVSHLLDDLDLPVEARGAALDQRDTGCQAHLVHMPPRIQIIQRIEDEIESLEPRDIEARVLYIVMIRLNLDIRIEHERRVFRNLSLSASPGLIPLSISSMTHQSLGLLDMLVAKQELPIEVAQINCVQIDDVDLAEAREDQVLQQFASDTASAHH
jgi:hypothetical protein